MRVMLIDPQRNGSEGLKHNLSTLGVCVTLVNDPSFFYDDHPLPHLSDDALILIERLGFTVAPHIHNLRQSGFTKPILVLHQRPNEESERLAEIQILNAGADRFLPLFLHKERLFVNLVAIVRRSQQSLNNIMAVGPVSYDILRNEFYVNGLRLELRPQERLLLHALISRSTAPKNNDSPSANCVSNDELMHILYGNDASGYAPNAVSVLIHGIRRAIAILNEDNGMVENIHGSGYTLREDGFFPVRRVARRSRMPFTDAAAADTAGTVPNLEASPDPQAATEAPVRRLNGRHP